MSTNLQAATSTTGAVLDPSVGDGSFKIKVGNTPGAQVDALSIAPDGTPTFLKDSSIGYNQTYQARAGAALATTYTNTFGKPIWVLVSVDVTNANSLITATVGGVAFSISTGSVAGYRCAGSFIVPAGLTYSVAATGTLASWTELR